jgi:hypothetical protein
MKPRYALLALPLLGCVEPALQVHDTNNENIQVEHLFTHDGCKVYRFRDGAYHYFVKCDGAVASQQTISRVSCGKACSRDEVIATEALPPRAAR